MAVVAFIFPPMRVEARPVRCPAVPRYLSDGERSLGARCSPLAGIRAPGSALPAWPGHYPERDRGSAWSAQIRPVCSLGEAFRRSSHRRFCQLWRL